MSPTEKAAHTYHSPRLDLSLSLFFREAGSAFAHCNADRDVQALAEQVEALAWASLVASHPPEPAGTPAPTNL